MAPVGPGRRVEATRVSEVRARGAVFSHDGKNVLAFVDKTGEMELTRYPANGVGEGMVLTKNASVLRLRAFPSPDGKWVAHHDKDRRLYLLNLATGEDREIARNRYDQFDEIVWSPDSRWLVIEKAAANYFETLQLMEVATGKTTALASDRYHARSATFSPDGKWLYFLGDRPSAKSGRQPLGPTQPGAILRSAIAHLRAGAGRKVRAGRFCRRMNCKSRNREKKPDTDKKPSRANLLQKEMAKPTQSRRRMPGQLLMPRQIRIASRTRRRQRQS